MHKPCIKHDALMKAYNQLGTDKPHVSAESKDKPAEKEEVKQPLSPKEPGVSVQDSIGVSSAAKDNVDAADANGDAPPTGKKTAETEKNGSQPPTPGSGRKLPGRPKKTELVPNGGAKSADKPYEGLFDVEIRLDLAPPQLIFTDLRENVEGGDKEWREPITCLLCGTLVV